MLEEIICLHRILYTEKITLRSMLQEMLKEFLEAEENDIKQKCRLVRRMKSIRNGKY